MFLFYSLTFCFILFYSSQQVDSVSSSTQPLRALLDENMRTFQKDAGVITHIIDGGGICHESSIRNGRCVFIPASTDI